MALLVVLLPLAGAVAALALGHRAERLAAAAAVSTTIAAWVISVVLATRRLGDQPPGDGASVTLPTGGIDISFAVQVDQLGAAMLLLATTVAALVQVYSVAYLRG